MLITMYKNGDSRACTKTFDGKYREKNNNNAKYSGIRRDGPRYAPPITNSPDIVPPRLSAVTNKFDFFFCFFFFSPLVSAI